jgi:diacylglycerol kinase
MNMNQVFLNAFNGIKHAFKSEWNFKIHLCATAAVLAAGVLFSITPVEWCVIVTCCILVLSFELMNTAIENVCDAVSTDFHPVIKIVKDISAGAVLVTAIGSAITGGIVFLPKIIYLIKTLL